MATLPTVEAGVSQKVSSKPPFYRVLWVQVLVAMLAALVLGYLRPEQAVAMKPLGDAFIRAISMIITLIIFCTVVTGIAGMQSLKKVGRVGGLALIYFEVVSTLALLIGLVVGTVVHPGSGFNVNVATLDAKSVAEYAGQAKAQSVAEFLVHIIPNTMVDAFAKGDILEVVFVALLFGFALSAAGQARVKPLINLIDALSHAVFGVANILMKFAPIGAFGAMAYTVGKYGLGSLGPLARLMGTFWLTSVLFVVIVLGAVAWAARFNLFRFLAYIKEEILLVLAVSSSETAIPTLMAKLERLGCSKSLVGLVVPTGYTFNTDGTSLYMTMAALFVAQATNTHLTLTQQLTIFAVAILTSKGASGVQGASFIALVGTLSVVPTIPVAGMALILGIDRFLSMFRAVVNMIGNGVATLVLARWEGELGVEALRRNLAQ
ncbi:MAG: dicarboxylate/amino acid:cation symporter [Acidobacteriia bacterium]|nr:dicarboxylate/amino acid:cation symporter [Terriglobia bacterium]